MSVVSPSIVSEVAAPGSLLQSSTTVRTGESWLIIRRKKTQFRSYMRLVSVRLTNFMTVLIAP